MSSKLLEFRIGTKRGSEVRKCVLRQFLVAHGVFFLLLFFSSRVLKVNSYGCDYQSKIFFYTEEGRDSKPVKTPKQYERS